MTYKPKTTPQDRKDLIKDLEEHFLSPANFFYDSADPDVIRTIEAIIEDLEQAEALLKTPDASVEIDGEPVDTSAESMSVKAEHNPSACPSCSDCSHPHKRYIAGRLHCLNCGKRFPEGTELEDEPHDAEKGV